MAMLQTSDWYDVARDTNWTPSFVSEAELFPETMSDAFDLSREQWETFDEPYKITYSEYVHTQHKKDVELYSVRSALARSRFYETADPGWRAVLQLHYGMLCLAELRAGISSMKAARFARSPGWRNMATFGLLDEVRHAQTQLHLAHDNIAKDRRLDWAHKTFHTEQWAAVVGRRGLDDLDFGRGVTSRAVMFGFVAEEGFTNLQFLGLAADAARVGDHSFATLIASTQTDETRHAQVGAAVLRVLLEHGRQEEAQQLVDIAFWRMWRAFQLLTGPAVDYYTPLRCREKSFKEMMEEWILAQFEQALIENGLRRPWYWDSFVETLDHVSHQSHLAIWQWRPTMFWAPVAGVSKDERDWLEEKYPGWNDTWGPVWDVIASNLEQGREDLSFGASIPMLCNSCSISCLGPAHLGPAFTRHHLDHNGRRYIFCSEPCQWIFEQAPERYEGHLTLVDRLLAGQITPPDMEGFLTYMGLSEVERGVDPEAYSWVKNYR